PAHPLHQFTRYTHTHTHTHTHIHIRCTSSPGKHTHTHTHTHIHTHRGEGAEHTIIHTITAHNPVNLNFTIKVSFFLCLLFSFHQIFDTWHPKSTVVSHIL